MSKRDVRCGLVNEGAVPCRLTFGHDGPHQPPAHDACRYTADDRTRIARALADHHAGTGPRDRDVAQRLAAHAIGCTLDALRDSERDEIETLRLAFSELEPGQLAAVAVHDKARAILLVSAVPGHEAAREAVEQLTSSTGATIPVALYHHALTGRHTIGARP
jgi:hypothetical protein